jgi:hypothetical protein
VVSLIAFFAELGFLFFLSREVINQLARFFVRITGSTKKTIYIMALIFFPGTFLHEISHFMFALFLLVPVWQVNLIPKINDDGSVILGSVPIGKTDPIRRTLIGIAPVILGISLIFSVWWYANQFGFTSTGWLGLWIFLTFIASNTMFSSRKDLEGTLELLIIIVILGGILWYLRPNYDFIKSLPVDWSVGVKFMRTLNLYLLIPVIVNSLVFIALKFANKALFR